MVYAPMLRGGGFAVAGDNTSPWIDMVSVYCRPIMYGAAIERADQDIKLAQTGGRTKPGFGHYLFGALAIGGVGYMILRKR